MTDTDWDIAVIGAGPAGLMAAGAAAEGGARVVVLEKNDRPGIKLLLTGKGRCNITNHEADPRKFTAEFGRNGRFLLSALSRFGVGDVVEFFNSRGVPTKVERGGRVFPESDRSADVLKALLEYAASRGVELMTGVRVRSVIREENRIARLVLARGDIAARAFILCTGGLSYPSTGSSGDGYRWARALGHRIVPPRPSLVSIQVREDFVRDLEGLSLVNVGVSLWKNNKKAAERFGEAVFTRDGMSGPVVVDLSREVLKMPDQAPEDRLRLRIDYKPALDFKKLDARILRDFGGAANRRFKNSLDQLLPRKLIPVIVGLSGIDPDKPVNGVTREERNTLLHLLKEFSLTVTACGGFEKAIITAGGVALTEVDGKTLRSKIIDNLYFAGEILDLDGPTGGYNLQVCWSTGFAAGQSAAESIRREAR